MPEIFKRCVTPIGLVACLLILVFLVAIGAATAITDKTIEQGVRQNFAAAGLLAQLQLEGEKMRRYEKEMFIYVGEAGPRTKYVAEFDRSYSQLLALLDTLQAPSSDSFSPEDRAEMARWKDAALFYGSAFDKLSHRAQVLDAEKSSAEQRGPRTVEFNVAIAPAKDRFRELLDGTARMRAQKEAGAQRIAGEIGAALGRLRLGIVLAGLGLIGLMLYLLRPLQAAASGDSPVNA